jgi:hypothetical protein
MRALKLILAILLFLITSAFAINMQPGFDSGNLPASQITTDCSQWTKNLSCANGNQQSVDNVVDQLSGSGTGTNYWTLQAGNVGISTTNAVGIGTSNPQGNQLAVNGSGLWTGVSAVTWNGFNQLILSGANLGIGSSAPSTSIDVVGTIRSTSFQGIGGNTGITGASCTHWTGGICDHT